MLGIELLFVDVGFLTSCVPTVGALHLTLHGATGSLSWGVDIAAVFSMLYEFPSRAWGAARDLP